MLERTDGKSHDNDDCTNNDDEQLEDERDVIVTVSRAMNPKTNTLPTISKAVEIMTPAHRE